MAAILSKRLVVLVQREMHDWLREQANEEQLEISDIARRALRLYRKSTVDALTDQSTNTPATNK